MRILVEMLIAAYVLMRLVEDVFGWAVVRRIQMFRESMA